MRRVVITGLGTVNPLGNHVEEFWANVKANKIGIKPVDQFDASDFDVKFVGSVKDFDPTEFIEKKEARKMDRFTQFAVCSTMQALNMAGTDLKDLDPFRVGVIIGVGIGGLLLTEEQKNMMLGQIAMKRFGEVSDIAGVISFLASEDSRYVTGQVIEISGGIMM